MTRNDRGTLQVYSLDGSVVKHFAGRGTSGIYGVGTLRHDATAEPGPPPTRRMTCDR